VAAAACVVVTAACGEAGTELAQGAEPAGIIDAAVPGVDGLPDPYEWSPVDDLARDGFSPGWVDACSDPVDEVGLGAAGIVVDGRSHVWHAVPEPGGEDDRNDTYVVTGGVLYASAAEADEALGGADLTALVDCLQREVDQAVVGRVGGDGQDELVNPAGAGDLSGLDTNAHELDLGDGGVLLTAEMGVEALGGFDHSYVFTVGVVRRGPAVVTLVAADDEQSIDPRILGSFSRELLSALLERVDRALDGTPQPTLPPRPTEGERVEAALEAGLVTQDDLGHDWWGGEEFGTSMDSATWPALFHACADLELLAGAHDAEASRTSPIATASRRDAPSMTAQSSVHVFADEATAEAVVDSVAVEGWRECVLEVIDAEQRPNAFPITRDEVLESLRLEGPVPVRPEAAAYELRALLDPDYLGMSMTSLRWITVSVFRTGRVVLVVSIDPPYVERSDAVLPHDLLLDRVEDALDEP
jgi:hypothetical protein